MELLVADNIFDVPGEVTRTGPIRRNNAMINWRFTLNNWRQEDFEFLDKLYQDGKVKYIIYGKEIAPTTGTPHLQGFLQLPKKLRFGGVRKLLGDKYHVDPADFPYAAMTYCKKDGEWTEYGKFIKQVCMQYE